MRTSLALLAASVPLGCAVLVAFLPLGCGVLSTSTGSGDAGTTSTSSTTTTTTTNVVTGSTCGIEVNTGATLCRGSSQCPSVTVDSTALPDCGFLVEGSISELVCACGEHLCSMGLFTDCTQAALLLTSQTEQEVCNQLADDRCQPMSATGSTSSTTSSGSTTSSTSSSSGGSASSSSSSTSSSSSSGSSTCDRTCLSDCGGGAACASVCGC